MSKLKLGLFYLVMVAILAVTLEAAGYATMRHVLRKYTGGAAYTGQPLNSRLLLKVGTQQIEYFINNYGFRDSAHDPEHPRGACRIVVFGDSFTEGWGVPQHLIWPARLQELLDKRFGPGRFEVINLAMRGTGPGFALKAYQGVGAAFKPAVAVFASYAGNDLRDAGRERKQDYDLKSLVPGAVRTSFSIGELDGPYYPFKYFVNAFKYFKAVLVENPQRAKLAPHFLDNENWKRLDSEVKGMVERGEIHTPLLESGLDNPDVLRTLVHEVEWQQQEAYQFFIDELIEQMSPTCRLFLTSCIPASFQVSREQFDQYRRMGFTVSDELLSLRGPQEAMARVFAEARRKEGMAVVFDDMTGAFARESQNRAMYLKFDDHMNAEAHAFVAGRVAEIIAQNAEKLDACLK